MLIHPEKSCLLVIDIQQRLLPFMSESTSVEANTLDLIEVGKKLSVPVLYSEQYPKGLGPTTEAITKVLPDEAIYLEKLTFSCAADSSCNTKINSIKPNQIIICGIESHVCVLQTAIQLRQQAREVYVIVDAVSSRNPEDKAIALKRMAQAGVYLVTKEMVIFEWMQRAGTETFKEISKTYLR